MFVWFFRKAHWIDLMRDSPESLDEDFQARRMSCQFEQPEDANDRKELKNISVFQMRGHLLKDKIDVEAQSGHVIDDVHTANKKIQNCINSP